MSTNQIDSLQSPWCAPLSSIAHSNTDLSSHGLPTCTAVSCLTSLDCLGSMLLIRMLCILPTRKRTVHRISWCRVLENVKTKQWHRIFCICHVVYVLCYLCEAELVQMLALLHLAVLFLIIFLFFFVFYWFIGPQPNHKKPGQLLLPRAVPSLFFPCGLSLSLTLFCLLTFFSFMSKKWSDCFQCPLVYGIHLLVQCPPLSIIQTIPSTDLFSAQPVILLFHRHSKTQMNNTRMWNNLTWKHRQGLTRYDLLKLRL